MVDSTRDGARESKGCRQLELPSGAGARFSREHQPAVSPPALAEAFFHGCLLQKGSAHGIVCLLFSAAPAALDGARQFGGIAQLGERLHGMQEVSGSIPLTSTKFPVSASGQSQKPHRKRPEHTIYRGYSSAGRALAWHARGQRFDPAYLHQSKSTGFHQCFFLFRPAPNDKPPPVRPAGGSA